MADVRNAVIASVRSMLGEMRTKVDRSKKHTSVMDFKDQFIAKATARRNGLLGQLKAQFGADFGKDAERSLDVEELVDSVLEPWKKAQEKQAREDQAGGVPEKSHPMETTVSKEVKTEPQAEMPTSVPESSEGDLLAEISAELAARAEDRVMAEKDGKDPELLNSAAELLAESVAKKPGKVKGPFVEEMVRKHKQFIEESQKTRASSSPRKDRD